MQGRFFCRALFLLVPMIHLSAMNQHFEHSPAVDPYLVRAFTMQREAENIKEKCAALLQKIQSNKAFLAELNVQLTSHRENIDALKQKAITIEKSLKDMRSPT